MKAVVLIGEMGSGKSHVGRELAALHGCRFIEGDSMAPNEMKTAIDGFRIITDRMIDDLVYTLFGALIYCNLAGERLVVVSQALYREHHRELLRTLLAKAGIECEFVWVRVGWLRNMRQLLTRPGGPRWLLYWFLSKPVFARPKSAQTFLNGRQPTTDIVV